MEEDLGGSDVEDVFYRRDGEEEREFAAQLAQKVPTKSLGRSPSKQEMEDLEGETKRVAMQFKDAKEKGQKVSRLDFMDSISDIIKQQFPRIEGHMIPAAEKVKTGVKSSHAAGGTSEKNGAASGNNKIGKQPTTASKGPRRINTTFMGPVAHKSQEREEADRLLREFFEYNEKACLFLSKANGTLKTLSGILSVDQVCQLARMTPDDPGAHSSRDVDGFQMREEHREIISEMPDFIPAPRYVRTLTDPKKRLAVALATHHYRGAAFHFRMAQGQTYYVRPLAALFGVTRSKLNRLIKKDNPAKQNGSAEHQHSTKRRRPTKTESSSESSHDMSNDSF